MKSYELSATHDGNHGRILSRDPNCTLYETRTRPDPWTELSEI